MFIVQGISRIHYDEAAVRDGEGKYDDILQSTEGMYWNIYLKGLSDPSVTIHTQDWATQKTSEDFGISAAFQARRPQVATNSGPRASMFGPLSPGYWKPVIDKIAKPVPTGRWVQGLGHAWQTLTFIRPGREQEYLVAHRDFVDRIAVKDGLFTYRMFRNIGQPNAFSSIVHYDEDASEAIRGEIAGHKAGLASIIEHEWANPYEVILSSDWPERRRKDGVA